MNKLTIVLSGRKQSGKTSSCNYIRARYLNKKLGYSKDGQSYHSIDELGNLCLRIGDTTFQETSTLINTGLTTATTVKLYSFADPLKQFLMNVFGLAYESCYGTDEQKNELIPHLLWENVPEMWRPITTIKHDHYVEFDGRNSDEWEEHIAKTGPMTGREIMQLFGTEICRKIYGDCWALGTYLTIKKDGHELALVSDARFPNEITMGSMVNAKTVRLLRSVYEDNHASEKALDEFPTDKYTVVLDNRNKTLAEQAAQLDPFIEQWFVEAGI